MKPLGIMKHVGFSKNDAAAGLFQCNFTAEKGAETILHVVFLGCYPGFKEDSTGKLQDWIAANPGCGFLAVVLNIPPKSWMTLPSTKRRIEEDLSKSAGDAPVCVVKYLEAEGIIPDGDLDQLHGALEGTAVALDRLGFVQRDAGRRGPGDRCAR